jgi:hypothetical protein
VQLATVTSKTKEWVRRYLPAEVIATVTALLSAGGMYSATDSYPLAAIAGTIGENVGYYGYFVVIEWIRHHKNHRHHGVVRRTILVFSKTVRDMLIEFGPAELLDSLLVRPFCMFVAPQIIGGPYVLGIFVGKVAADLVFYSIAIVGYEAKKRWLKT